MLSVTDPEKQGQNLHTFHGEDFFLQIIFTVTTTTKTDRF